VKGLMRNDPDVIIVGEVRTADMAQLLLRASRTGHLVLSTAHADDTGGTIHQLRQWTISQEDLASQVRAVIALRLLRILCVVCRVKRKEEDVRELLSTANFRPYRPLLDLLKRGNDDTGARHYQDWYKQHEVGCSECNGTGYRGRRLVYELLRGDPETKTAIRNGHASVELNRRILSPWNTLAGQALKLVVRGVTSIEEIRTTTPIDVGVAEAYVNRLRSTAQRAANAGNLPASTNVSATKNE
jgi:type IV pilus assembly protein PilB